MSETAMRPDRRYSFTLPPGWLRLDLRGEAESEARRFADVLLAGAPRDRVAAMRSGLVRQVAEVANSAKVEGVLDLVLPVMVIDGATTPASIAIAPFDTADLDPVEVLVGLAAADPSAELVEVSDLVALRTVDVGVSDRAAARDAAMVAASAAGLDTSAVDQVPEFPETKSRRVRYYLGDPDRPESWVIVMLSVLEGDSDESRTQAAVVVELFDQIVLTMRFDR